MNSMQRWSLAMLLLASLLSATAAGTGLGQHQTKLVGFGASGAARQGASVAISADGSTAIVGGPGDSGNVGAAWVYVRTGNLWSQQGPKLFAADAIGTANFGTSVSLSSDGNTAIIGGPGDNGAIGAAWVFIRTGGIWSQQGAKLIGTGALFTPTIGFAVALSSDGNTAFVGGPADFAQAGAAWVFTRSAGTWSQQGDKLVGSLSAGDSGLPNFGHAVALSGDGNTAIAGGFGLNSGSGAAWVFVRAGGVWSQQGSRLVGTDAATAHQGQAVALSGNGDTALVGGWTDNASTGATWVFTRASGVWSQQGTKLASVDAVGAAKQGASVALSADGNRAIVGGSADNGTAGATWIYGRAAGAWSQQGPKQVATLALGNASQGSAAGLYADGSTAIIGAPGDNASAGAAWILYSPPCTLDIDGDASIDALTDGLIILRAMLGLTGNTVTANAVGANATRTTWAQLQPYMNANCGAGFAP